MLAEDRVFPDRFERLVEQLVRPVEHLARQHGFPLDGARGQHRHAELALVLFGMLVVLAVFVDQAVNLLDILAARTVVTVEEFILRLHRIVPEPEPAGNISASRRTGSVVGEPQAAVLVEILQQLAVVIRARLLVEGNAEVLLADQFVPLAVVRERTAVDLAVDMHHARHGPRLGAVADHDAGNGLDLHRRETVEVVGGVNDLLVDPRRPQRIRQHVQERQDALGRGTGAAVHFLTFLALARHRTVAHADRGLKTGVARLHVLREPPRGDLAHVRVGQAQSQEERIGGLLVFAVLAQHVVFRMRFLVKLHRDQLVAPLVRGNITVGVQPVGLAGQVFSIAAAAVQIGFEPHADIAEPGNEVFIERGHGQVGVRRGDLLRVLAVEPHAVPPDVVEHRGIGIAAVMDREHHAAAVDLEPVAAGCGIALDDHHRPVFRRGIFPRFDWNRGPGQFPQPAAPDHRAEPDLEIGVVSHDDPGQFAAVGQTDEASLVFRIHRLHGRLTDGKFQVRVNGEFHAAVPGGRGILHRVLERLEIFRGLDLLSVGQTDGSFAEPDLVAEPVLRRGHDRSHAPVRPAAAGRDQEEMSAEVFFRQVFLPAELDRHGPGFFKRELQAAASVQVVRPLQTLLPSVIQYHPAFGGGGFPVDHDRLEVRVRDQIVVECSCKLEREQRAGRQ